MPRIDPLKLLTCLKVLLASNGGIRSENEVKRLAGLMTKYSKKLVSKCIYIQILKCTNTELLGEFMGAGGWSLTHMWLSDGIHAMNWPLVQEILELLLLCPVDVQKLRSNTAPKLVKGLCQNGGNEGVKILATKLVEQWLKVVKGETPPAIQVNTVVSSTSADVDESVSNENISLNKSIEGTAKSCIVADSSNSMLSDRSHITVAGQSTVDDDPLAIPSSKMDLLSNQVPQSPSAAQKANTSENALVYQIVVKDGKQVLAKIENSSSSGGDKTEKTEESVENENKEGDESIKEKDASNKENEKQKLKESENKDSKEIKESSKDKEKSKSSKDKDKDKHRSSSHKSSSSSKSKSSSSSSSKSKSSSRSSSDGKSRDKDKDSDRESEKDKHRSSSSNSKSSSSSNKDRSNKEKEKSSKDREKQKEKEKEKDKEKEKERQKVEQTEKDKQTLSKVTPPPIDKLGKIPKKPKDETEKSTPTSITIPSKKASMSIEIRKDADRPKTVKTYKSQFRSHGLSEEAPPPPSRKGLKKPTSQSVPGTSIPSLLSLNLKRSSPPPSTIPTANSSPSSKESGQPAEKKLKLDLTNAVSGVTNDKPGAIKLIAPKPKPSTLVESDLFMDALSASAYFKKDAKKRKRRPSASKEPTKDGNSPAAAAGTTGTSSPPESPQSVSPTAAKVTPLKFYQDTLEEKDEDNKMDTNSGEGSKNVDGDDRKDDEDDIPLKKVKESIEEKVRLEKEEEERKREMEDDEDEDELITKPPGPGCGPDGPPGVLMLHRRKGPKKKLSWKRQEELEDIRYFELDETERVNVTKTFTDMKQMERFNEREAFIMARKLNCEDIMTEQTTWMPLILVDDVPPHPEGNQSKEKKIQAERELTTLKALYFNRHMIPDSPSEPDMDMEQYQKTEPAVIPLDDITGNPDAVNDFTSMPWPDPKGSPPQCMPDDFNGPSDVPIPNGPFNPYMQFGAPNWPMGGPNPVPSPGQMPGPNNMMPPNLMGGPPNMMSGMFNNMGMGPPNMMMGPDDMPMNQMNMNMMQPPFGPNFGGPPNPPNFNNFGPPAPNMNMNAPPNIGMNMGMNMNMNNGPRGRGGNWRSGSSGPPPNNQSGSGGQWRPQGPAGVGVGAGGGGSNRPNWTHGNSNNNGRICKQFQRGFCRNGNKCNFLHPNNNKY